MKINCITIAKGAALNLPWNEEGEHAKWTRFSRVFYFTTRRPLPHWESVVRYWRIASNCLFASPSNTERNCVRSLESE